MMHSMRQIHLRPRLETAALLLQGLPETALIADIGCDHGRLSCALLQRRPLVRCIGTDVSETSLQKAERLAALTSLAGRIEFRVGDGLATLAQGETDAVAICGMGGALIARLLAAAESPLMGARLAVLQPMRGVEELRQYLFETGYFVREDRVVRDAGRLYQVFSVTPPQGDGARQTMPAGFPPQCFSLGFTAYAGRDPLLPELARQQLAQAEKRLQTAAGTRGERILRERAETLQTILKGWDATCD